MNIWLLIWMILEPTHPYQSWLSDGVNDGESNFSPKSHFCKRASGPTPALNSWFEGSRYLGTWVRRYNFSFSSFSSSQTSFFSNSLGITTSLSLSLSGDCSWRSQQHKGREGTWGARSKCSWCWRVPGGCSRRDVQGRVSKFGLSLFAFHLCKFVIHLHLF